VQLAAEAADAAVWGNVDDLDEFRAGDFEASARGGVFGIACDPDGVNSVVPGKREQQSNRARGVVMAAVRWMYSVADVSGVLLDVRRRADADVDLAEFLFGVLAEHAEGIRWDAMKGMDRVVR